MLPQFPGPLTCLSTLRLSLGGCWTGTGLGAGAGRSAWVTNGGGGWDNSSAAGGSRIFTRAAAAAHRLLLVPFSPPLLSNAVRLLLVRLALLVHVRLLHPAKMLAAASTAVVLRHGGLAGVYLVGLRRRGPDGRQTAVIASLSTRLARTSVRFKVKAIANPVKVPAKFPHSKSGNEGPGSPRRATAMQFASIVIRCQVKPPNSCRFNASR